MKLLHITLTIEQLRGIPDKERALFVLLSHALNEINTLHKLLLLSSRLDDLPTVKAHAQMTQALLLARLLHGKLYELRLAVGEGYSKTQLAQKYSTQLDHEGVRGLQALKKYFGPANVVNKVRNQFAFHYSLTHAVTSIPDDTPAEELAIYLHENDDSCLYYFAEFLMRKALIVEIAPEHSTDQSTSVDESGASLAMKKFFDDMSAMVSAANAFSHGFISMILDIHIGREILHASSRHVEIGDVPHSNDAQIPYFVDLSPPKSKS